MKSFIPSFDQYLDEKEVQSAKTTLNEDYTEHLKQNRKGDEYLPLVIYLMDGADEDMIDQNSEEDGITVDWDILNKEISEFERTVLNYFKRSKSYGGLLDQGHSSDGSLIITVDCYDEKLMENWANAAVEEDEPLRFTDPQFSVDDKLIREVEKFINKSKFFHLAHPSMDIQIAD